MPSVRDHHMAVQWLSRGTINSKWEISAIKNQLSRVTMCQSFDFSLSIITYFPTLTWISTFFSFWFTPLHHYEGYSNTKYQASHRMPFSHIYFLRVWKKGAFSFSDGSIIIKWIWVTISGQFFLPSQRGYWGWLTNDVFARVWFHEKHRRRSDGLRRHLIISYLESWPFYYYTSL